MQSKRFDSEQYVKEYQETGKFPAIHDELFNFIAAEANGERFCDLCCSTGLLGQRLKKKMPGCSFVMGVECDHKAIEAGKAAGVTIPVYEMTVNQENMPNLTELLYHHQVTVLVARRCLPEIFGADSSWRTFFVSELIDAGITEVFIQGRNDVKDHKNPLHNVTKEVELFHGYYKSVRLRGQCAHVRLA